MKYPNVSTLSNFHCLERAMRPELLEIVRYCGQYICLAACCRFLDSMCQGNLLNEKWKTKKSAHITCLWFNVSTGVLSMWALVVTLENIITHWQIYPNLGNSGQLPVHEVLEGTDDCLKFLHYVCFWDQGVQCRHSYWATMFGKPRKSRSTSGSTGTRRYWWLCLIDSHSFFTIYVFEVKESISDITGELPCLRNPENPGQLPVQEDLRGTDHSVLWIFENSSQFMFLRSRNPLLIVLPGYPIRVTSKKLGQLPVQEVLRGTDDCVLWNFAISSIYMFSRSGNHLLTFLLCYYVWGTSKIQNKFWFWRFLRSSIESSSCTEGCPGYSKSLKHGILVEMPAINSLTSKT